MQNVDAVKVPFFKKKKKKLRVFAEVQRDFGEHGANGIIIAVCKVPPKCRRNILDNNHAV